MKNIIYYCSMKTLSAFFITISMLSTSCNSEKTVATKPVRLITVDPGHFHAALVQKSMYNEVDSVVHVYAPAGPDIQLHLGRINGYNTRSENPTHWKEETYTGDDFFEKMLTDKAGNVVVLAGNNQKKTDYISRSLQAGLHVLADKPMVIDDKDFDRLKEAFATAAKNKVLLYDIMTERSEITTLLQREFSMLPAVFGTLEKGTPQNPAITKISIHHFYKYVSGSVLTRPAWFMDISQQGEGLTDVMTHLVDLVQWECFPDQSLDYTKDVQIDSAKRWTTDMNLEQFRAITRLDSFPSFLHKDIHDTVLKVYSNGEINYRLRGVHAKTAVTWAYKAPEGTGDTHYSMMRGTKANLVIRQGAEQQYKPALYIEPVDADASYEQVMREQVKSLQQKYPGIELKSTGKGWEVVIPEKYKEGHEAHFARVMERFLTYLQQQNMPAWEVPNMVAKYYTTTKALALAKK
jgi:predicted dehydrogenase